MPIVNKGFSLIELVVTVAIIAILATIAYPSYTEYVHKSHRSEIAGVLSESAQILERQYSKAGTYADSGTIVPTPTLSTGNDYYTIVPTRDATSFTLTAQRKSSSLMGSDKCGDFVLTNTGARTNPNAATGTTTKQCWGR